LANISAAANACKQNAVTFKVFVPWLHNQCYYTRDVIGLNYPTIGYKAHAVNINFMK